MRLVIVSFAFVTTLIAAECPPRPAPQPLGDAAPPPAQFDASVESLAACANLADAGCEDGMRANCGVAIDHARLSRVTPIDLPCLTTQRTKAALRGCGAACP